MTMPRTTALTALSLDGNTELADDGLRVLCEAIAHNRGLQSLSAGGMGATVESGICELLE